MAGFSSSNFLIMLVSLVVGCRLIDVPFNLVERQSRRMVASRVELVPVFREPAVEGVDSADFGGSVRHQSFAEPTGDVSEETVSVRQEDSVSRMIV